MYPTKKEGQKTIRVSIDPELYDKFIERSKEKGYTNLGSMIRDMIKEEVK